VNCYDLEEQPHGSTEKNSNPVCFHGAGEARKKEAKALSFVEEAP
jgi:hypothetical protein